jgi:DNA-binding SARP family transcriptional activator/tetratricopeptide (TPR) repeat protein
MTRFGILGPVQARAGGDSVALGGPRQVALLAFLVLHANRPVSRDALIDGVWGSAPEGAVKRVQMAIARLRRALEPLNPSSGPLLRTVSGGYMLLVGPGELDVDVFSGQVESGLQALREGDPRRAAELLAGALRLWRGPPLAEVAFEDFAQGEIRRLEELRLSALEARIEADLQLGRHSQLISELKTLTEHNPFRERLTGQLMLGLYRCGRQADALDVYQSSRRHLAEQLGLEPGPALSALQVQILEQADGLELTAREMPRRVRSEGEESPSAPRLFVGYDRQLEALSSALERALAGRGGVALIAGEPGMGKSRLADELGSVARARGMRVLWGRCWEAGGAPAYWPWIQALRTYVRDCAVERLRAQLGSGAPDVARLLPELREILGDVPQPEATDPDTARFRLFDAVSAFVRRAAAEQPLVLVLDDLHAADQTSLLLLIFLAEVVSDARVLVVVAYRSTELPLDHPLQATVGELGRAADPLRLVLKGLTEADTSHFVELSADAAPLPRLAGEIHRATGGNPLFVSELVRLLAAEGRLHELDVDEVLGIPHGVHDAIARRAHRLSASCRRTLAVAAAIGREFEVPVLQAVCDAESGDVAAHCDEAVDAGLIEKLGGGPSRLRFSHALVRDTLYRELPSLDRTSLHGAIGEALERVYAGRLELHLAELAHHFLEAAPERWAPKAAEYARRAGARAAAALAYEESARLYGLALDAAAASTTGDSRQQGEIVVALGEQLARGDNLGHVRTDLPQAIRQVEHGSHPDLAARATIVRCLMDMFESARCDEQALQGAIGYFCATGDWAGEARAQWALSWMCVELGQLVRGREAAERSLECARRSGDRARINEAAQLLAFCLASGPTHVREVVPMLRRLRADLDTEQAQALLLVCLGFSEAMGGNFKEARHAAEQARTALIALRNPLDVARCDVMRRAEIERWAGDLEAAERFAREGCDAMERHRAVGLLTSSLCVLAEVLIAQGRFQEAQELVAKATVHVMDEDIDARFRQARARARTELATGNLATGESYARVALDLVLKTQLVHEQSDTFFALCEILVAAGNDVKAHDAAHESLVLAQSKGHVIYAQRARDELDTIHGPPPRQTRAAL